MKELKDYNRPAALADLVGQLGVDPRIGLSRDDAMARRALYGANRVTPPINCPSWVCCLLPCLLRTASMQAFHAVLPREAVVRRQATGPHGGPAGTSSTAPLTSRSLRMDASSLVVGDIVELAAGDLVSADMRVVECSSDCVVDQSTLAANNDDASNDLETGDSSRVRKVVAVDEPRDGLVVGPLQARNVLLMASRVVRGRAVGVVVATGDRTFWGRLLRKHEWPVASTSKCAGRVDKYVSSTTGTTGMSNSSSTNPEEHRLMADESASPTASSRSHSSSSSSKATTTTTNKAKRKKKSKAGELVV